MILNTNRSQNEIKIKIISKITLNTNRLQNEIKSSNAKSFKIKLKKK